MWKTLHLVDYYERDMLEKTRKKTRFSKSRFFSKSRVSSEIGMRRRAPDSPGRPPRGKSPEAGRARTLPDGRDRDRRPRRGPTHGDKTQSPILAREKRNQNAASSFPALFKYGDFDAKNGVGPLALDAPPCLRLSLLQFRLFSTKRGIERISVEAFCFRFPCLLVAHLSVFFSAFLRAFFLFSVAFFFFRIVISFDFNRLDATTRDD